MRALFAAILLMSCALVRADVTNSIDVPLLQKLVTEKGLCSDRALAYVCRGISWGTRTNEGAVDYGGLVYVFIQSPPTDSSVGALAAKFPEEKKDQWTSFFAVANSTFFAALTKTSYNSVIVLHVTGERELKVESAMLVGRTVIQNFAAQQDNILAEIKSATGEWIPPEDFSPEYEYKSFVQ